MTMALLGLFTGCKTSNGSGNDDKTTVQPPRPMPQGQLIEVSYHYQGMAREMIEQPRLSRMNGKPMLEFDFYGEKKQFEVSDTLFDAARTIIEEERMYEYSTSYSLQMNNERILDGYSWSFDATFLNPDSTRERLSSHGRNAEPDGNGLSRMRQLLHNTAQPFAQEEMKKLSGE